MENTTGLENKSNVQIRWAQELKRYEMGALLNNGENASAFVFSFSTDEPLVIVTDELSDAKSSMGMSSEGIALLRLNRIDENQKQILQHAAQTEIMSEYVDGHRPVRLTSTNDIKLLIQDTYEHIAKAQGHEPIEHDFKKETLSNCLLKIYISDVAAGRLEKTVSWTPKEVVQSIQEGGVDRMLGVYYLNPMESFSNPFTLLAPHLEINYTTGEGQLEKAKEFLAQEMAMFDEKVPQERIDFCNEVMKQLEIAIDLEAKEASPVSDAVLEETPTTTPKHEPTTLNESEDVLDGTYTPSQTENTQPKEDIEYDESQIENEL